MFPVHVLTVLVCVLKHVLEHVNPYARIHVVVRALVLLQLICTVKDVILGQTIPEFVYVLVVRGIMLQRLKLKQDSGGEP